MGRMYFEDLPVGWKNEVGRWKLEEADCIAFAKQWDPQPFHIDPEAASQSIYGGLTASSLQLFAVCTRLFFDFDAQVAVLAMLGKEAGLWMPTGESQHNTPLVAPVADP